MTNKFPPKAFPILLFIPVLLPYLILVGTGWWGVDFGDHWDQNYTLDPLKHSVKEALFLPRYYVYPSVNYWLSLVGAVPAVIIGMVETDGDLLVVQKQIVELVHTHTYHLQMRGIYLVVSALSVVWVYVLVLLWRKNIFEALLAACLLGFSWEVGYHLRWVAPDGVVMQFTAFTIMCAILAQIRPQTLNWIWGAAIGAGLACGTKYPAFLLIVPVLISAYFLWPKISTKFRSLLLFLEITLIIFILTYLFSTPGTILDPITFISDIRHAANVYRTGQRGYTMNKGLEHLARNIFYLATSGLSYSTPVALFFFLSAIIGTIAIFKEAPKLGITLVSFPIIYVLYMSNQRVMIIRNMLAIMPFLAILSARGIAWGYQKLPKPYLSNALMIIVTVMLTGNALWLIYTAQTIADKDSPRFINEASNYITSHPEQVFLLSPQLATNLDELNNQHYSNATTTPSDSVDFVLLYASEGMERYAWKSNQPNLTVTWFGPWDINFNYYPSWGGNDRIILMTQEKAQQNQLVILK
ncbi:glycosyltransferase family 39 protein [Anaerolineales bacterium HSG6]|nr:glycosyltransferase family 39 protein [Anaerolineales bacterium HSG6]